MTLPKSEQGAGAVRKTSREADIDVRLEVLLCVYPGVAFSPSFIAHFLGMSYAKFIAIQNAAYAKVAAELSNSWHPYRQIAVATESCQG